MTWRAVNLRHIGKIGDVAFGDAEQKLSIALIQKTADLEIISWNLGAQPGRSSQIG
jgi:hypothetical protein